ncbi:hypothetical protein ACEWY4_027570 [Coilia grayii]|uniref:Transmembrane protein 178B n=1 Tax=Coilia grayii TaxID=363190 RepID=A0ABD1IPC0_9TELE
MAATKILTGAGLFLALCSLALLAMAICTDHWYETDARRHRERCKNYANKRKDPGYISISKHNLPLQMLPRATVERRISVPVDEALLRVKRQFMVATGPGMESQCSRQFNSTISGLWRKCLRDDFDLEMQELIYKGENAALHSITGTRACRAITVGSQWLSGRAEECLCL